jgi:putative membrane protein
MDGGMTGWLWPVVMLAGLALVVYVLVRLVRDGTSKGARDDVEQRPSARELLDERYARGELDDDEYERRRRNLA